MRLLSYDTGNGPRCGVIQGDEIVDVSALVGTSGHPLRDVRALLEQGNNPIERVSEALAKDTSAPRVPLAGTQLRSPVIQPPTVRDFIVYEEHASNQGTREPNEAWYRMPVFYFSNPLCIYGPDAQIPHPSASSQFDYELEIGCVIGKEGSNVAAADALDYIAGFTLFNDWSSRDLQVDEMAFGLGPAKGKDTASSIGPWLVTTDEIPDPSKLTLRTYLNDDVVQESGTDDLIFDVPTLIAFLSGSTTLLPGTLILTGTPSGVGSAQDPRRFLMSGDEVTVEIEGIGKLTNFVVEEALTDEDYEKEKN